MNLTNEQRAHDLAIAILPFINESLEIEAAQYNEGFSFEPYTEYLKAYNSILSDLNRDLPPTHH